MTKPNTDETLKIPDRCPKCAHAAPEYKYDEVHNEIAMRCPHCGYRWSVPPLDRQEQTLLQMEQVRHTMMQQMMAPPPLRSPIPGTTAGAPADPVRVYNCHPEAREHIQAAMQYIEQAERLHDQKKKGMSAALCNAIRELRAAEVLL